MADMSGDTTSGAAANPVSRFIGLLGGPNPGPQQQKQQQIALQTQLDYAKELAKTEQAGALEDKPIYSPWGVVGKWAQALGGGLAQQRAAELQRGNLEQAADTLGGALAPFTGAPPGGGAGGSPGAGGYVGKWTGGDTGTGTDSSGRPVASTSYTGEDSGRVPRAAVLGSHGYRATAEDSQAVIDSANRLGIDPRTLSMVLGYETNFNPGDVTDTKKGYNVHGIIGFDPENIRKYGPLGPTIASQVPQMEKYLLDRGWKPGVYAADDLPRLYSIVNAGSLDRNGNPRWGASDSNGSLAHHVANIRAGQGRQADAFLGLAGDQSNKVAQGPALTSPTGTATAGVPYAGASGPAYAPTRGGQEDGVQSIISALAGTGVIPQSALPMPPSAGGLSPGGTTPGPGAVRPGLMGATASVNPPSTGGINPPPMGGVQIPGAATGGVAPGRGPAWPAPGQTRIPTTGPGSPGSSIAGLPPAGAAPPAAAAPVPPAPPAPTGRPPGVPATAATAASPVPEGSSVPRPVALAPPATPAPAPTPEGVSVPRPPTPGPGTPPGAGAAGGPPAATTRPPPVAAGPSPAPPGSPAGAPAAPGAPGTPAPAPAAPTPPPGAAAGPAPAGAPAAPTAPPRTAAAPGTIAGPGAPVPVTSGTKLPPGVTMPLWSPTIAPTPQLIRNLVMNPSIPDSVRSKMLEMLSQRTQIQEKTVEGGVLQHNPVTGETNFVPIPQNFKTKVGDMDIETVRRWNPISGEYEVEFLMPGAKTGAGSGAGAPTTGGTEKTPTGGIPPFPRNGSLQDLANWQTAVKANAAETEAYSKESGARYAKLQGTIANAAVNSQTELPQLRKLQQLMKDDKFYSGLLAHDYAGLSQVMGMFGIGNKEQATLLQIAEKLGAAGSLQNIRDMADTGAVRIPEMHMIEKSNFDASNTKDANQAVVETRARLAERQIQVADFATNYLNSGNIYDDTGTGGSHRLDYNYEKQIRDHFNKPENQLFTKEEIEHYNDVFDHPKEAGAAPSSPAATPPAPPPAATPPAAPAPATAVPAAGTPPGVTHKWVPGQGIVPVK